MQPGCELRLAATASLEAMAGVIALTYQRKLQGGDLSLTRHMERLAVAGDLRFNRPDARRAHLAVFGQCGSDRISLFTAA